MRNFFEQKKQGEVIIENVSEEKEEKIEDLISKFGESFFEENQKQAVISIETIAKGMLRVLTNSSQTAKDLTGKIEKVFNGKVSFIHPKKEFSLRAKVVLE